jgi:hypothetical protein
MSINDIQLSENTRRILFTKTLVEITPSIKSGNDYAEHKIKSLGGNEKNALFLVKDSENKFLGDEEMNLLSNLITACKLTMAEIALVNNANATINYQQLSDQFQAKKILMFGVGTSELNLPFSIPDFQIQPFQEQLYLTAPPLKQFLTNKDLKKELWICLQKLFLNK